LNSGARIVTLDEKLGSRIDAACASTESILADLIGAGRTGEAAVQQRVAAALAAVGAEVEVRRYSPMAIPIVEEFASAGAMAIEDREAVVARKRGHGRGKSVILFAHPDSEPISGTDRWQYDPFAATVSNGRIYGWGVADDLAGVAAAVDALTALNAAGLSLNGDVIVASTPSKRHARGIAGLLHGGLRADAAVYLHPAESGAGMGEIKALASGQVEFRIEVDGRSPDTTEPLQTGFAHLAVDPIGKAWHVWTALRELDARRAADVLHPALDAAVGRSTNLMISHITAGDLDWLARAPTSAVLAGALSFPPPEKLTDVQRDIMEAVSCAMERDPWLKAHPPRLTWISGVTGAEVSPKHPLYGTVAEAVQAVCGKPPCANVMHTSSDIRNPMVQAGIPTVGLGPLGGDLTQNGRYDEWVDAADYVRSVRVVARLLAGWCGVHQH
jgi:acetylornithine deacetylase